MEDARREILNRVARGEISPEEGAARLDEFDSTAFGRQLPTTSEGLEDRPHQELDLLPAGLAGVRVRSEFGSVQIIGDPFVREAVADGPHSARHEDGRLVIEHSHLGMAGDFSFGGRPRRHWTGSRDLIVRMNPALTLDLQATAGSVRVVGVQGPISGSVQAGSTTIDGFRGPLNLRSQAGSVRATGLLSEGESRISCQAGSVRLHLAPGSSVRIRARAQMGRVRIDGETMRDEIGLGAAVDEVVVGEGRARLEIEASMGSVRIETAR